MGLLLELTANHQTFKHRLVMLMA